MLSPTPRVFFSLHLFDLTSPKALCTAESIIIKIILFVQNTFVTAFYVCIFTTL